MSRLRSRFDDDILVVTLEIDTLRDPDEIRMVGSELLALRGQAKEGMMLLDCNGVNFMTSSMVGQLFLLGQRCKAEGIELIMCNVSNVVREIFDTVRLVHFVEICESEQDARESFCGSFVGHFEEAVFDIEPLQESAKQGNVNDQYELARCYDNGWGVEQDATEAISWYRKSAKAGHADAQYKLGTAYAYAIQVDQDYEQAVEWYQRAAEQGHVDAQYAMGMTYRYGLLGEPDQHSAALWYQKAAQQDHGKALEELDRMRSE